MTLLFSLGSIHSARYAQNERLVKLRRIYERLTTRRRSLFGRSNANTANLAFVQKQLFSHETAIIDFGTDNALNIFSYSITYTAFAYVWRCCLSAFFIFEKPCPERKIADIERSQRTCCRSSSTPLLETKCKHRETFRTFVKTDFFHTKVQSNVPLLPAFNIHILAHPEHNVALSYVRHCCPLWILYIEQNKSGKKNG